MGDIASSQTGQTVLYEAKMLERSAGQITDEEKRDLIMGLINKAAEHIKDEDPIGGLRLIRQAIMAHDTLFGTGGQT